MNHVIFTSSNYCTSTSGSTDKMQLEESW